MFRHVLFRHDLGKLRPELDIDLNPVSESRDSDCDGVSPVVDSSGPMRKSRWRIPTVIERTHRKEPRP